MKKTYPPDFTYQDFARDFTAEFYNPDEWAEILQTSGAKYDISLYTIISHLSLDIGVLRRSKTFSHSKGKSKAVLCMP